MCTGISGKQSVNILHNRPDCFQGKSPGHRIGVTCPVTFCCMSNRIEGGRNGEADRHSRSKFRIDQSESGIIVMVFEGTFCIL